MAKRYRVTIQESMLFGLIIKHYNIGPYYSQKAAKAAIEEFTSKNTVCRLFSGWAVDDRNTRVVEL